MGACIGAAGEVMISWKKKGRTKRKKEDELEKDRN
jgi:hypothetical protein